MKPHKPLYTTTDQYIALFPEQIQELLTKMRQVIRENAPEATEAIVYQMPTFRLQGKNLVHFAAFDKHIGFYPTPSGVAAFADQLVNYVTSKGAIQFPLDKTIPYDIVKQIVQFRVKEVLGQ